MSFTPIARNRDNIQFAELRKTVDPKFEVLHDTLSAAYYDHWKHGNSMPWQSYDVQATPKESKTLFDKLHGLIADERQKAFHEENLKLPEKEKILEAKYNEIRDKDDNLIGYKSDEIETKLITAKSDGFEITTEVINAG